MDVRVRLLRKLSTEELMLLKCVGEDSSESLGLQGDQTSQYSLEELMQKLELQYFGHLMQRTDSLEKTLMLGRLKAKVKGAAEDEIVRWYH